MKNKKILLIEDNESHAKLALLAMNEFKDLLSIDWVKSAEECLEYIKTEIPSIILLDINLPGKDGLDLLRDLKSQIETKFMPIIVLTTSNMPADKTLAYSLNVNSYLVKPINYKKYKEMMYDVVKYWVTINIDIND